jgi:Cys-tRNA(Pro)/Cys-tRNA(Cys) deacylase
VSSSSAAASLNARTLAWQVGVSIEGKMFSTIRFPARSADETESRLPPVRVNAGASLPTSGSSPLVFTVFPPSAVWAMGLIPLVEYLSSDRFYQDEAVTPAIELLRRLGIVHRIVEYDHDPAHPSYGDEAAEALGVEPSDVFKTLLATLDDGTFVVGVVPVSSTLDLKALAAAAGAKKARMTDPAKAERHTGYVVGGISPFGQKRPAPTFVDEWATALDEVHCSGGRRGLEIAVAPDAFEQALAATFAPIASWP